MNVAVVVSEPKGPIWTLLEPVARETGATLLSISAPEGDPSYIGDRSFSAFDVVHFGYSRHALPFMNEVVPPIVGTVNHIEIGRAEHVYEGLIRSNFSRLVVTDRRFVATLGEMGFTNVTFIPQAFDHAPYRVLPIPEGPFTIGTFGTGYPQQGPFAVPGQTTKRFHIVEAACRLAGCEYLGMTFGASRKTHDLDMVEDFFSKIHCYVNASFCEGGPLPPQQAFLCGRPVITTRSGFIESLMALNGAFFDGSVQDLAKMIRYVQGAYEWLSAGARATRLPNVYDVAQQYMKVWERVVDE